MRSVRDCHVCVVGGAGFLGSHLVDYLVEERDCKVLVIDNLVAGRKEFIHKDATFEHHDITGSENYLRGIFHQHKIKYVFQYAAYPYIPVSFERPLLVADVNFMGALKVINAAQEAGVEGILQVSSAEIYGDHRGNWDGDPSEAKLNEDAPVRPHSTYGASKAAMDYEVQARWREAKTPCLALRQFNCVGPKETHPYVVPEIISQLSKQLFSNNDDKASCSVCGYPMLESESMFMFHGYSETCEQAKARVPQRSVPVVQLGNNSFRDFLYAGDQVRITVELLERGQWGEVYNLGSEMGIKIYDLAKLIGKIMGFAEVRVEEDESRRRPWEIWHLQSDNTKIYEAINHGFTAEEAREAQELTSLEEALRRTISWFNDNGRKWGWEK